MVGAYGQQSSVPQGLSECFAVGAGLYGGVALDACAQLCIVLVAEEQVGEANFTSNCGSGLSPQPLEGRGYICSLL